MTGSLQSKGGMFYAVYRQKDTSGKTHQVWKSLGIKDERGNKRRAQAACNKIIADLNAAGSVYTKDVPFAEWTQQWLESKRMHVEQITYEGYNIYITKSIFPYFSKLGKTVKQLTAKDISDYYAYIMQPHEGASGLSPNSIKKYHVVIHGALQYAVDNDIIPYNPADRVKLPRSVPYVGSFYTEQQAKQLLQACRGQPIEPAIMLGLFLGLRRSEVVGLRWCSVDFQAHSIEICNTVTKMTTIVEKERTKNKSSNRTLPMNSIIEAYLLSLYEKQQQERAFCGPDYRYNGHVCVWPTGEPFRPDYITSAFAALLKKNDLPHIRFHDLRHTCASLLLGSGVDIKRIQEWLGHSNLSTTANVYSHLEYRHKEEVAEKMGSILFTATEDAPNFSDSNS